MAGIVQNLWNYLSSINAVRVAAAALAISLGVFAVVLLIFGLNVLDGHWIYQHPESNIVRAALSGAFVTFFLFVWFLMYVQITREADDVYSRIRGKLEGGWLVNYEATNGPKGTPIFDEPMQVDCVIRINPNNKKLELKFNIRSNPAYQDGEQVITAVALRHDVGGRYELFYYFEGERKLKGAVQSLIVPDQDFSPHDGLRIEVFGILRFEDVTGNTIAAMSGEWFDLNGKVTQIFALVDEARSAALPVHAIAPKHLSEVDIRLTNFAAKMGGIEFRRLAGGTSP